MKQTQEQYVLDKKGQKTGVILPIEQYDQIMEDFHDIAIVAERRNENTISLREIKRRLKK